MIGSFLALRLLVLLRRIDKTLLAGNEIAAARLQLEKDRLALDHPNWYRAGSQLPTPTRKVTFDRAEVDDWNKRHQESDPNAQNLQSRP